LPQSNYANYRTYIISTRFKPYPLQDLPALPEIFAEPLPIQRIERARMGIYSIV
jgi:hypothetical protein